MAPGCSSRCSGGQERAADLLFRVYRFFRLKNVGDDRPFSSLRRTVEHEAFIALMARDIGVRTPRLRGVVDVGEDSMLLAYEMIDGSSIDGVAPEVFTDDLMRQVWEQVAILRDAPDRAPRPATGERLRAGRRRALDHRLRLLRARSQ